MFRLAKGKKNIGLDFKSLKIGKSFWFQDSSEGSEKWSNLVARQETSSEEKKNLKQLIFFSTFNPGMEILKLHC